MQGEIEEDMRKVHKFIDDFFMLKNGTGANKTLTLRAKCPII